MKEIWQKKNRFKKKILGIKKFDNDLTMKHTFDKNKVFFTKKEIFLTMVVIKSLKNIRISNGIFIFRL